jgi:hypothetical protein
MPQTKQTVTNEMIWNLLLQMQSELLEMKASQRKERIADDDVEVPNAETQEIIRKTDEAVARGDIKHITSLEQYMNCVDTDDDDTVYSFANAELSLSCLHYDAEHMEV